MTLHLYTTIMGCVVRKLTKGSIFSALHWALYKPDQCVIFSFLVCHKAHMTLSMIHFTILSVQHSPNDTFCASFYHSLCAIRHKQHCSIIHGLTMTMNVPFITSWNGTIVPGSSFQFRDYRLDLKAHNSLTLTFIKLFYQATAFV